MKFLSPNTLLYLTVYFVQAIFSLAGIAKMVYLQKEIGLSPSEVATLEALVILPWTIKPLYGVISDLLPIRKMKRKPYIFFASLFASLSWMYLSFEATSYNEVLFGFMMGAVGLAFTDVATDGLIVERANPASIGKIQSLCWGSFAVAAIIGSFYAGTLSEAMSAKEVFFVVALFPLLTSFVSLFVKEEPKEKTIEASERHFMRSLGSLVTNRNVIIAAVFVFLWYVTPSAGTPFFYYMKDHLGFSEELLGQLGSINSFGTIVGAVLYAKFIDRFDFKRVLFWTIIAGTLGGCLTFFIVTPLSAVIIYFASGIIFYLGWLPVLKFLAQVAPKGVEATSFALLASIMNLGKASSEYIGGQLFDLIGLWPLVWVSILTTLLALPLVPFLRIEKKSS